MRAMLRKMKLNNQGDTLAIVLIGILIVGVLGTVILKASSVNVSMKVNDLKSKQNFYYVEKAVDDIYTGIGKEVTVAAQKSYDDVMSKMVTKGATGYTISSTANTTFVTKYLNESGYGIKTIYPNTAADVAGVVNHLKSFVPDYSTTLKVNVTVEQVKDSSGAVLPITDPSGKATMVEYDDTNNRVIIKNVVVRSKSTINDYEASITTDFVISTPNIDFTFSDTSKKDLSELYKYAIIANGGLCPAPNPDANQQKGSVEVKGNNVTVNGNIYAGSFSGTNPNTSTYLNKEGIYVDTGAALNVNGANIVSTGAVELGNNATVNLNGESVATNPHLDPLNLSTLRLWAKDILLTGNAATSTINGDCFIRDDLEVNGNNGIVNVTGSYYGFGFSGTIDRNAGTVLEDDSKVTAKFDLTEGDQSEHSKRSAVIVNGNNADVQIASDSSSRRQVVVGGRAYIDLSGNANADSNNADYMTGESVAIKGNQKIYLLDNPSAYQGDSPSAVLKGNPMQISDLGLGDSFTSDTFYNNLKLDRNSVVAKRVGSSVYFYNRQTNPDIQTQYVAESVRNTTKDYWDKIQEAVTNMNIVNLSLGDNTESYTAGTAMQVKSGALTTGKGTEFAYQENGIDENGFANIIQDIENRYKNITYDFSDDRDSAIGSDKVVAGATTGSPYDYYIQHALHLDGHKYGIGDRELLRFEVANPSSYAGTREYPGGSGLYCKGVTQQEFIDAGVPPTAVVGLYVGDNNRLGGKIVTETDYGVIICTGDVEIDRNFTGMIICGGNITINGNYTFTANPKLMELLREKSEYLQKLIDTTAAPTIVSTKSDLLSGVPGDTFAFNEFVSFDNWRKNAD